MDVKKLYIEWGIEVFEEGMVGVLLGEDGLICWNVPIDTEGVIEDADTTFCLGMIELVTLVLEHRSVTEDGKAVGEAFRDEKLETNFSG